MSLKDEDSAAARARALAFEANMAIEGVKLSPEGRILADQMDKDGVGYEEGVALVKADLRRRGIITS